MGEDSDWEASVLAEKLFAFAVKRPSDVSAEDVVTQLRKWLRAELVDMYAPEPAPECTCRLGGPVVQYGVLQVAANPNCPRHGRERS